jgi:tetratricopeptide (TPR) repeat protein
MVDPGLERGAAFESQGDLAGAEDVYSRADQLGDAEGAFRLGLLLRRRGDLVGAEAAYRRAEQRGDPRASCNLAVILEDRGDVAGAEAAYCRADAMNFPGGAYGLGQLLYARGDIDGSIRANRRADELGDADAAFNHGILLQGREDLDGALEAFGRADDRGSAAGASALGRMLERQGSLAAAEAAYRRAEERGESNGAANLGVLLVNQGQLADGIEAFKRAVALGHPTAAETIALLERGSAVGGPPPLATSDPAVETAVRSATLYAAACGDVIDAANICTEVADHASAARNMAARRPQHEISIRNFTRMAEQKEQEFVPLYRAFVDACAIARDAAATLLIAQTSHDPELLLLTCVEDDAYGATGAAAHLIRADLGPTPAGFVEGLQRANFAIQADVFGWDEAGFQPHIYSPPVSPPSEERTCQWCAETIKAAALVCRFCGRDVQVRPNVAGQER